MLRRYITVLNGGRRKFCNIAGIYIFLLLQLMCSNIARAQDVPFAYGAQVTDTNGIGVDEIKPPEDLAWSTLSVPPALTAVNFQSVSNAEAPPDCAGAVGPTQILTMVNGAVEFRDKSGTLISNMSLFQFWTNSSIGGFDRPFDPEVQYDPYSGRFIAVVATDPQTTNSAILIGVSITNTLTGGWHKWKVNSQGGTNYWADRPRLGYNKQWIVVQCNMAPIGSTIVNRAHFFCFNKTNLYSGTNNFPDPIVLSNAGASFVPAVTLDPNLDRVYVLQSANGDMDDPRGHNPQHVSRLRLLYISDDNGTAAINHTGSNALWMYGTQLWSGNAPGTNVNFLPQLGGAPGLFPADHRFLSVIYRDGFLYGVHHVFVPVANPTRTIIQMITINPSTATIVDTKRHMNSDVNISYAFPSLAVNQFGDTLIGFNRFSTNAYPDAMCVLTRRAPGRGDAYSMLKAGEGSYWSADLTNRNRWGDFSSTLVDPLYDRDFWTFQQFSLPHSGPLVDKSGRYSTIWANVLVEFSTNDNFAAAVTLTGSTNNYTGDFVRATKEAGEPNHIGNANHRSVWFNWTSLNNSPVHYSLISNTFPVAVAFYTGTSVTALTLVTNSPYYESGQWLEANSFTPSAGTTYRIAVVSSVPYGLNSHKLSLGQMPPPYFVKNPTPKYDEAIEGEKATFSALAVGQTTPDYQWRFQGINIAGATATNYTISNVTSNHQGAYDIIATNSYGAATSQVAILKWFPSGSTTITTPLFTNNAFRLTLTSVLDHIYTIQGSTNLSGWVDITNQTVPFAWPDLMSTNYPYRFYRMKFVQ